MRVGTSLKETRAREGMAGVPSFAAGCQTGTVRGISLFVYPAGDTPVTGERQSGRVVQRRIDRLGRELVISRTAQCGDNPRQLSGQ